MCRNSATCPVAGGAPTDVDNSSRIDVQHRIAHYDPNISTAQAPRLSYRPLHGEYAHSLDRAGSGFEETLEMHVSIRRDTKTQFGIA